MADDKPVQSTLSELHPGEVKEDIWTYDETTGKWIGPDGSLNESPPPMPRKPGFQKGDKRNKTHGGPKSTYSPKFAKIAREACARGMTDIEVRELLDIGETTFHRWKNEHALFAEAFRLGKRQAHDRVERSLYHKAVGYTYLTERVVSGHKVTLKQHLPPDTAAAIFYLKNRRPQKWKDIHRQEVGPAGAFDQIEDAAELRKLLTQRALELGLIETSDIKMIEGKAVEITDKTEDS